MRRPLESASLNELAELLEPETHVGERGDFAFAPTVHVNDVSYDEPVPSSRPMIVNDSMGHAQCLTPLAFPLPPPSEDVDLPTQIRGVFAQARHGFWRQIQELEEIWRGTAEMVDGSRHDVPGRVLAFARRLLAVWSCWQWNRDDIARAAIIGMAVFVVVASTGAAVTASGQEDGPVQVRAPRTLDQHTGKVDIFRSKR